MTPNACAGEVGTHAPQPVITFVEHQQDAVLIADRAQAVEIALRRRQAAERTSGRFHEHRGDVLAAIKRAVALQVVRQIGPVLRLTLTNLFCGNAVWRM